MYTPFAAGRRLQQSCPPRKRSTSSNVTLRAASPSAGQAKPPRPTILLVASQKPLWSQTNILTTLFDEPQKMNIDRSIGWRPIS
ncbi:MAG: hypothetical protein RBS49_07655, partial [Sphaerochaeta sp.]|nr:hypothetical protein [Sphaerochaeta sp.]